MTNYFLRDMITVMGRSAAGNEDREVFLRSKQPDLSVTDTVNAIVKEVYNQLKQYGFRRYGQTIHRFTDEDISQVINFQVCSGSICVNIGIRVPECAERDFHTVNTQKYYHEYNCNIRSRLGTVRGRRETWYSLSADPQKTAAKVIKEMKEYVLPFFTAMSSRQNILDHRRDYPLFDTLGSHLILLDEAMIFGRLGDMKKAKEQFELYYRKTVEEYNDNEINGKRFYLKKGESIQCGDQHITAKKNGYVTIRCGNRGHIEYLDGLAEKLRLRDNTIGRD